MKLVKMLTPPIKASVIVFAFLAALSARANSSFDWTGEDGVITVPDGVTAIVSNCDLTAIANLTKITCAGTTSRILFYNTEPFTMTAEIDGPGNGAENADPMIEMTAQTGKITFAANCKTTEGRQFIVGNVDVESGVQFGPGRNTGSYGSIQVLKGCTIDFKPGSKLTREYRADLKGPGTFRFACQIPTSATQSATAGVSTDNSTFVFESDNLFNAGCITAKGTATLDLNGHPQTIPYVSGGTVTVKSETPAALTINGTTAATFNFALQGAASIVYRNSAKMTVEDGVSATTGSLDIESGTVELKGSAVFHSGTINVTGGKLTLGRAKALGLDADVVVSDSGVLDIPKGYVCAAKSLTINGDVIGLSDPVSMADLAATYPNNVSGEGFIGRPRTRYVSLSGDDGANGETETTAWKTFAFACAQLFPAWSKLIVLPGVYNEGEMTKNGVDGACRLVVPDGLVVASRDGAETTVIEGKAATSPIWNGCGEDSCRCVYVGNGSRLEGFTLRGGRAMTGGTTKASGGGVYAAGTAYTPGDAWIVDCVITNCASHNTGGASFYGKFLRCSFFDCSTPSYASGIRCGAAYNCYFRGMANIGSFDAGSGAPAGADCVGNTFIHGGVSPIRSFTGNVTDCVFVGTVAPNNAGTAFRNCLFTTAPSAAAGATTNGVCRVVTEAELALDAFGRPTRTSVAVNAGVRADYEAAMPAGEAGLDGSGLSRYLFGGLDVGAYEYDPRADFSATLGDGVTVKAVTDDVVYGAEDKTVVIPSDAEMSLGWTLGQSPNTEFSFDVSLTDGAALEVYDRGTLLETVTEPKMVSFMSDAAADLRLVATGEETVEVSNFRHDTTAVIVAEKGGVELTEAEIGINYVTDGPLTFTMKRKLDSSDVLSTGFTSNGVFYAWTDYPDGWTYTVSDRASSINVAAVYADPLDTWYVAQDGGDDNAHYGRLPEDAFATIQKALGLAKKGDTVYVGDGIYDSGEMGDLSSANGGSRIVVPEGVTVRSVNGRAKTRIVGRKATVVLSGGGCGTDSLRCAQLMKDALLIGFTLTNGYSKATTTTVSGGASGGGVLGASGSAVIDCTITKCVSANVGGVGQYGSYIGCRATGCEAVQTYGKGVRDPELVCNCYLANLGNGFTSSAGGKVYNSTFVPSTRGDALLHNYSGGRIYNCRFALGTTNCKPESEVRYLRCFATSDFRDGSVLEDGSTTYTDVAELREAANEDYLDNIPEKFREWARTIDADGNPRILNGQMDVGGTEYDIRPDFAQVLAPDGTVTIDGIGPRTVLNADGTGVVLPDGETMTLEIAMPPVDETTFQFTAELADGATLTVYANGELLTTLTESGKVTFEGTSTASLRLVPAGEVTVHDFRNAVKAAIDAPKNGITVEGAQIGDNYVGSKPLTFTVRRAFDAYEQYSTGFKSNGVFYAWADFPDGFTYTVSDIDSAIAFAVVYDESPTEWYVSDADGDDTANFGRHPTNPLKTIKKALEHAKANDTVYVAPGVYGDEPDDEVMGEPVQFDAQKNQVAPYGYSRICIPANVTVKATGTPQETVIVGRKATTEILSGDGCGPDSARCAYLASGARLIGFTLTGGYSTTLTSEPKGADGATEGGGYNSAGVLVSCIVSNNVSAAVGGPGTGGYLYGCRIGGNRAVQTYGKGVRYGYLYNCYLKETSNVEGMLSVCSAVVNCTIDCPGWCTVHHAASYDVYNTIHKTSSGGITSGTYKNCLFTSLPKDARTNGTCRIVSAAELALDENGVPDRNSVAVDDLFTGAPRKGAYPEYANCGLMGCQRVYNGRMDIGAAEYDWRDTYRDDLGAKRWLAVEAASSNVVETADGAVRLADGSELTLKFTIARLDGEKFVDIPFVQSGAGTLTATLDGAVIEPKDGAFVLKATAAEQTLVLSYSGEGYADFTKMRRNAGVLLIVR